MNRADFFFWNNRIRQAVSAAAIYPIDFAVRS
jgi:hypothetical protein